MSGHRHPLFELLAHLDLNHIHYSLSRTRPDSIGIFVTLVARRIEIFVFEDGHFEYSVFAGSEDVLSNEDDLRRMLGASS
ncbi:hypothetical protein BTR14_22725 [Rhizobium rhizosphaerae]|uniref:Uncharacterized protein n=1 Tax=Xaviernesmea rhizosphaerae TaxID=1672749 RepID=A0ABX3P6M6_9HYPH|nr:hypothetical protein BTR14_22725 [Xaviernesmea rhizosphaerae]